MGVELCLRNRDHVVIVMQYFPHEKFQVPSYSTMFLDKDKDCIFIIPPAYKVCQGVYSFCLSIHLFIHRSILRQSFA